MSTIIVGLWLNGMPKEVLKEDSDIKHLCKLILQGRQAREIFVAESSLLLSLDESLPSNFFSIAAQKLRSFFISKKVSRAEMDTITISPYTDRRKWEILKEQIAVAVSTREWNTKDPEDWSIGDTLKWLRDQNLGQYCLSFKENDIDGQTLLELNERDLQDLGIRSIGHRKKLMRLLNDIYSFNRKSTNVHEGQSGSVMSIEFKHAHFSPENPRSKPRKNLTPFQNEPLYLTVMIRGLSESFLKDGDALFDIKNSVFANFIVETFEASPSGILITFKSPMTSSERMELKEKLLAFFKSEKFQGKVKGELEIDWQKDREGIPIEPLQETKAVENSAIVQKSEAMLSSEYCPYWGMYIEGLPRFIMDDGHCLYGIQKLVFKDIQVRRIVVLSEKRLPMLKVEFLQRISPKMIPYIAHNLKTYLKGSKVDEETIDNVRLSCLEKKDVQSPRSSLREYEQQAKRKEKNETFLIPQNQSHETARTILIEGIPEFWLEKASFLRNLNDKVFEGVAVHDVSVTLSAVQSKNAKSQKNVEIHLQAPLNKQKLPMIALRLKRFLKGWQIPPQVVTGVTIQVWNEKNDDIKCDSTDLVVGLVFSGIPKRIISSFDMLADLKSEVLTDKHAVQFMEPFENHTSLRILFKSPIRSEQEVTAVAQRLNRFLGKRGVLYSDLTKVLVTSTNQERWDKLNPNKTDMLTPEYNPHVYVGVEIKNIPPLIRDSDVRLEALQNQVFAKQNVANISVIDNNLWIKFGEPADKKAIELAVRDLNRALSQMKVPIKQINKIKIIPHLAKTWGIKSHLGKSKKTMRRKKQVFRFNARLSQIGENIKDTIENERLAIKIS